jgi:hypothetical protein
MSGEVETSLIPFQTSARDSSTSLGMTKGWLVREIASINDSRLAEEMLWRGASSQWKNAITFRICLIAICAAQMTIAIARR